MIARAPDPRDRRALRAGLTEKGRALIDEAVTAHVENEAMVTSALSRAEQEELDALLAKLLAGLPER